MGDSASDQTTAPCKRESDGGRVAARILLVEDEALIAEIIGEALVESGYDVHVVASAEEALAHINAGEVVDILFTDINLPGAMDGAALALHLRGAAPLMPVIYASGRWGLLEKLDGQPRSATLQKPYSPARACEAVQRLLAAAAEEEAEPAERPAAMALAL